MNTYMNKAVIAKKTYKIVILKSFHVAKLT